MGKRVRYFLADKSELPDLCDQIDPFHTVHTLPAFKRAQGWLLLNAVQMDMFFELCRIMLFCGLSLSLLQHFCLHLGLSRYNRSHYLGDFPEQYAALPDLLAVYTYVLWPAPLDGFPPNN